MQWQDTHNATEVVEPNEVGLEPGVTVKIETTRGETFLLIPPDTHKDQRDTTNCYYKDYVQSGYGARRIPGGRVVEETMQPGWNDRRSSAPSLFEIMVPSKQDGVIVLRERGALHLKCHGAVERHTISTISVAQQPARRSAR